MADHPSARILDDVVAAHRVITMQEWYLRVGESYIEYVEPEDKESVKAEMDAVLTAYRAKLDALDEFQRGVVYGKMYALWWVLREPDTDLESVPEFVEPR
jgi:hypothetical protein